MKFFYSICCLGIVAVLLNSCSKDDFPVPPASTVPNFTYTVDNDAFAPATVTFNNTSIVPSNVGNATYYWNFGDSTSAEGANPTHLYKTSGAYRVSLVVVTATSLEVKEITKTVVIKDANASGTPIFFTDGSLVYSALLNNQAPVFSALPIGGLQESYGMIFDTIRNKLYISDSGSGKIFQSDPDGTNLIVFRSGLDVPNAMRVDYQQNQLYWDTSTGIQRGDIGNSDVNQKEDFVTGQTNDPDGISIDAVNRTMYWVNYNGGVWKKNLDGTGEAEIIPLVEGGSLLVVGDRIYFDQYIAAGDIQLKSANLDGTGIAVLATGISRVVYGLAYEELSQKIYWGDRSKGTIMRANLDGSNAEPWYVAAGSSPRGIAFGKKF